MSFLEPNDDARSMMQVCQGFYDLVNSNEATFLWKQYVQAQWPYCWVDKTDFASQIIAMPCQVWHPPQKTPTKTNQMSIAMPCYNWHPTPTLLELMNPSLLPPVVIGHGVCVGTVPNWHHDCGGDDHNNDRIENGYLEQQWCCW